MKMVLVTPPLWPRVPHFIRQLMAYRKAEKKLSGFLTPLRIYPCLADLTKTQEVSFYFYQDCWAFQQVTKEKPSWLLDIGSSINYIGFLSQLFPTVFIDVRPLRTVLDGLTGVAGDVLALPFQDCTVPCITTMCVLEHIGLGRYGDELNVEGTWKAVEEIKRVVAPGGLCVYSVPVGNKTITEFNAHRRFKYKEAVGFFEGWKIVDWCVLTPSPRKPSKSELSGLWDAVGCFCVRKPR